MSENSMNYIIENRNSDSVQVIIEPWAEEFSVPSGSKLSISILYDKIGALEVEMSPDYFTVWLWAGCRAGVTLDGKDQTPRSLSIPAPV